MCLTLLLFGCGGDDDGGGAGNRDGGLDADVGGGGGNDPNNGGGGGGNTGGLPNACEQLTLEQVQSVIGVQSQPGELHETIENLCRWKSVDDPLRRRMNLTVLRNT